MKSEMEKCGRFLVIAIFFLFFISISTAQGAWTNDDLMYAKWRTEIRLPVHNINTTEDFENIQAAIDDPDTKDRHTISVDAGIYRERVVINKQLKLIGEDKDTTIIDGYGSGNCIKVTADNVEIRGFTIKNGNYGIYLESSNCRVIDNYIISIDFDGIALRSNSVNNTIAHNNLSKVKRKGIRLSSSCNNRIHDNDLSKNGDGISLYSSHNNIIYNNRLTNNSNCGLSSTFSKNNVIQDNDISGSDKGIDLSSSDKNNVYHNNFMDNRIQAKDSRDTNRWDKGPIDGGNYWSDHECTGNPSDGSQPYDISGRGATDKYPFMNRDGWLCTLPSPPTLADPGTNDTDGNYTVSWSSVSNATNYILEEDTSSSFSSSTTVYSGSETSKGITGKSEGTYYYQVKACNACGCSEWSNRENITIDTILPTVNITYPTNEQTFGTTNITVNGTASDNVEVSKVEVEVESGSCQTASGTTSWSTPVTLVPGPNTINASATDTAGNIKNTSVMVICDITPPVIYHEPITTATEGEYILISATITDSTTKVANANLSYRITSEGAWITISMDHVGDNYSATIPASHVTTAGVGYYIEAVDDVLNTAHSPATAPEKPYSITVIGESSVTISAVPSTINLSESVNISGIITRAHSANVTLTFTTPNNATQKNSTTSTPNGRYYFVFQPEEVGKWTVYATWAGDPDIAGNTSKTVSFIVIGESSVTISAVPSAINLSESVNISGIITRAHSANVTLTFTTPNNATQKNSTTSTPNGRYYFVFKPEEVGKWTVYATWAGDSEIAGNTSKTVSFTVNADKVGYAIIIAGRTDDGRAELAINISANNTYEVLLDCSFTKERMFYLHPRGGQDVDGDGKDDVDNISSHANIIDAIEKWAQDKVRANAPLLIYLVGHYENDTFIVNGKNDILNASSLNNSLNCRSNEKECDNITVVCEGPDSGNFIDNLSRTGRVIVTSTCVSPCSKYHKACSKYHKACSKYHKEMGGVFSHCFFNNISSGKTIEAAFENASNSSVIRNYSATWKNGTGCPQTPWLDADGDRKGHNRTELGKEGPLAGSRYIGRQCDARDIALTNGHSYNNWIPAIKLEDV